MPGIFDDERRGSGPMAPDPGGTGRFFARAASRAAHGDPTPPRRPLLTLAKNRSRQTHHLFPNRPLAAILILVGQGIPKGGEI